MRPYQDIVRAWAADQPLEDLSPEQRRVIALIASGAADERQLGAVGAEFARGIKAALPHQQRGIVADVRRVDGQPHTLRFKFSDETPDRMGDIIRQAGWNLDNYRKNAVILWGHARSDDADADEPIGRGARVWVEDKALWGDVEFASEHSERAARKERLAAAGYIKANSVGFRAGKVYDPKDEERSEWGMGRFGVVFESGHELLENSLCAVPANPNALQASVKAGTLTEGDADELHAQRTEKDWERYLKRRSRSFVALSATPGSIELIHDDRIERALESIAETQRALAPLVQLAPALTALAHSITDLGGRLSAPRQVAPAPAPATKAPALSADEERVLTYLRDKTKST